MRIIYKIGFLFAVSLLFSVSSVLAQDKTIKPTPSASPTPADKVIKPKDTDQVSPPTAADLLTSKSTVDFPDVQGWEKGEVFVYPQEELGYSINYESETGGRVTVYVYNAGIKTIPNSVDSDVVKMEMATAKSDIKEYEKRGYYENVREIVNDKVLLGGEKGKVTAMHSLLNLSAQGRALHSEIYLFPYKNNFIKIRATRPKGDGKTPNAAVVTLLESIDVLFSK